MNNKKISKETQMAIDGHYQVFIMQVIDQIMSDEKVPAEEKSFAVIYALMHLSKYLVSTFTENIKAIRIVDDRLWTDFIEPHLKSAFENTLHDDQQNQIQHVKYKKSKNKNIFTKLRDPGLS